MVMMEPPIEPLKRLSQVQVAPVAAPRMKRVAIFISCDSFEAFYGGTFGLDRESYLSSYRNDFVWEYAEGLSRHDHEVVIYVLSFGKGELHSISSRLSVRFLPLSAWLRLIDPLLYRLRNVRHGPTLRDNVAYLAYGAGLRKALITDRIDVIYHQEIWTPRFDIVTRRVRVPVVGADQGASYAAWMENAKRRSMRRAKYVLCQSAMGLERARAFGGNAVLFRNGVDVDFFIPPEKKLTRSNKVLAVGRLVEQKRFPDLLRAMQYLPEFSLVLVGSGAGETSLRQLSTELGIASRVSFLGFVDDRVVLRGLYQECGVFVSTSAWEAVALVVLEAMSCGAPVVVTRIPSFEELLTDGKDGLLIPVDAPQLVAEAIRLARNQEQSLGAAARETVLSRYSSQSTYRDLSAILQSV